MSRSNSDKPFYVDVGTSIVAVRCASNHDVVLEYDHSRHPFVIELAKTACDRMNREAEIGRPRRNCDVTDKLLRLSSKAITTLARIYNIIREVGRGELTADNALHQLIEDYHNLRVLSDEIDETANVVEKMQERIKELEEKEGGAK